MTQLDLRRRIVRYLIECDRPIVPVEIHAVFHHVAGISALVTSLLRDGILHFDGMYLSIRNLSDAEQWLIDTMPRVEASE